MRKTGIFLLCLAASIMLALYLDNRLFVTGAELNIGSEDRLSTFNPTKDDDIVGAIDKPELKKSQTSHTSIKKMSAPESAKFSENHSLEYSCDIKKGDIEYTKIGQIFKWIDDSGYVHYSDKAPTNEDVKLIDKGKTAKVFFNIDVSYPAGNVPTNIGEVIKRKGKGVYKIYERFLSTDQLTKSEINVLVYANSKAFERKRQELAPSLRAVQGFYTPNSNKAVVLHEKDSVRTERVAIHETAHVIHAHNFGRTPKWFNEGMAEVFEYIRLSGQSIILPTNKDWVKRLGNSIPVIALSDLLASTRTEWSSDSKDIYYANAWAFSHFMLLPENQIFMKAFMEELLLDKCHAPNSEQFFDNNYPGGFKVLASRWLKWVQNNNKYSLTF